MVASINLLPPSPLGSPPGSGFWNDWYEKLRTLVNSIASGFSWSLITGTPTTLGGYGITDAQSKLVNSAGLAAALSDETGTGLSVFNTTPTLVTPVLGVATGTSVALTALSKINGNAAALPTALVGTLLQVGNSDGTATRVLAESFGAAFPGFNGRRAQTTAAAPSALASGDIILAFQSFGYGATGYAVGSKASFFSQTTQAWTDTANGTKWIIQTTPNGSTTATVAATFDQDQSLTIAAGITTGSTTLHTTTVALTNGAAAQVGTLNNSPAAGNPTKWIPINDNGTTRYIPCW
jgi:hypothetical protein